MKILNFGSMNIDFVYSVDHMVKAGETITSKNLQIFFGGKGFNQSLAIARAGVEVYHAGLIGNDGKEIINVLNNSKVNVDFVDIDDNERTGNAIIQKDKTGNNCIILYPGANRKIEKKKIDDVFKEFGDGDILLLQNEINFLPEIVKIAKSKGMIIVLNPSPLDEKIFEIQLDQIDYFILNEIEARGLIGESELDTENGDCLSKKLLNKFPNSKFVLTLGEKGSIYIDSERKYEQGIFKVKTVDTTAAGDTFTGYFIAGLKNNLSIEENLENAAKASAIAVTKLGAEPSIPTIEEVRNFNYF